MIEARKTLVLTVMVLFLSSNLQAQPLAGWSLVWSDECNGAAVDTSKWGLELNEGDPGIAVYTKRPQNLLESSGSLVLQAQKESYNGKQYTSTQISTRNKAAWKYCRIDVRARLPYGQGMWPAIWMMPSQPAYGGWPRSGEIDIMENLGNNTRLDYTTLHYGASNASSQGRYTASASATLSDSFHVYTMIWDSGSFSFYLDSTHNYWNVSNWSPDNVAYPKPFDQPFFLMFDLAVGGSWAGPPDTTTVFPQGMLVDWVHVYQRQSPAGAVHLAGGHAASDFCVRASGNILNYDLKRGADTRIALCDAAGRKVASIVDAYQAAGSYSFDVATSRVAKGVYVCVFESGGSKGVQRIVLK